MNRKNIYVGLLCEVDGLQNYSIENCVAQYNENEFSVFVRSDGTKVAIKTQIIAAVNECCAPDVTVLEVSSQCSEQDTNCAQHVEGKGE